MCGIVGVYDDGIGYANGLDALRHRGPDDAGTWTGDSVWLGHRRLSIIDLTPAGAQPMVSADGRWVLCYNGEVYNHGELRASLSQTAWRGTSDTESIVESIAAHGVDATLPRLNGIFAFAAWDRFERKLHLVRDRLGIKPLYVAQSGKRLAFASELRALIDLPWIDRTVDPLALEDVLRYGCVGAPRSILRGVRTAAPGSWLTWDGASLVEQRWWTVANAVGRGLADPFRGSLDEAGEATGALIDHAVRQQMVADVPLGAFLSGGIDSSAVVAAMQAQSSRPVRTFTISFAGSEHDEGQHAAAVASHLGTDHHNIVLDAATALDLVPRIADICDEPFADNSILPTWLLCRETRRSVTVALSGDGGDELFAGYPRYFWAARIARWRRRLGPASALAGSLVGLVGERGRRLGGYLRCRPERVYPEMIAYWRDPSSVVPECGRSLGSDPSRHPSLDWGRQMMACDQEAYLPDDILTKVDRASMAVSLEARVPLLDHRLVEWAWRLPPHLQMQDHGDRGKLALRSALYRRVPSALIDRPKQGFGMPIADWLRGRLRPWAEALLARDAVVKAGLLDPSGVSRAWSGFLAGRVSAQQIWCLLMIQQWWARWLRR